MNKFRARQLDASRPIAIWIQTEHAELNEQNNVTNRTVPQLPTGMEKEEETEHHLQQAIYHQRVIPVPEVFDTTQDVVTKKTFDKIYPPNFKIPRKFVHIHPFEADQTIVEYDLDSADELWLEKHCAKGDLPMTHPQFEDMMDRLEKASGMKAVTLHEAKMSLQLDHDLITAVYDYWLNKRLVLQHALIPAVRSEKGIGSSPTDPYVAFRKRTEKMQTRKNRKNDEASYEKMLKLKRDLASALNIIGMVAKREKLKQDVTRVNKDVYDKRYEMEDFSGSILNEIASLRPRLAAYNRPAFGNHVPNHQTPNHDLDPDPRSGPWRKHPANDVIRRRVSSLQEDKQKRPYRKKRRLVQVSNNSISSTPAYNSTDPFSNSSYPLDGQSSVCGSEDEFVSHSDTEDDSNADGQFTFRRKAYVTYHAPREPSGGSPEDTPAKDPDDLFRVTSVNRPTPVFIGSARRRVGRGGRMWLDRASLPTDIYSKIKDKNVNTTSEFLEEIKNEWPHFHPRLSPEVSDPEDMDVEQPLIPHCILIEAEVIEGDMAGTFSQVEVLTGQPVAQAPRRPPTPHSKAGASRFWTWENEPCGQVSVTSLQDPALSCSSVHSSSLAPSPTTCTLSPVVKNNHSSIQTKDTALEVPQSNHILSNSSQKLLQNWSNDHDVLTNGPSVKAKASSNVTSIVFSETGSL